MNDEHDDSAERLVVLVAMTTRTVIHRHLALSLIGKVVDGRVDWMEVVDALADADLFKVLDEHKVQERLSQVIVKSRCVHGEARETCPVCNIDEDTDE